MDLILVYNRKPHLIRISARDEKIV